MQRCYVVATRLTYESTDAEMDEADFLYMPPKNDLLKGEISMCAVL